MELKQFDTNLITTGIVNIIGNKKCGKTTLINLLKTKFYKR